MILARREYPLDVSVQCPHDADARKHRRAAFAFGDQDQRLDRSLPLLDLLFCLRQVLDISTKTIRLRRFPVVLDGTSGFARFDGRAANTVESKETQL
jgi:hypothetical protein